MTTEELQSAKDALQKAIYGGVLEVRFMERWIKYQSLSEMRKALSDLNSEIASTGSSAPRSMSNFAEFNG